MQDYRLITEFILLYHSKPDIARNSCTLNDWQVYDVAKFSEIIGRMENYLVDKEDYDNFDLMLEYFKREFDERSYEWSTFQEHIEFVNQNNDSDGQE